MWTRRERGTTGAVAIAVVGLSLALAACTDDPPRPQPQVTSHPTGSPVKPVGTPTVIATNLDVPWSMLRLPTGSTLVSERETARIKEVEADGTVRVVGVVPGVVPNGEGGLLGLAIDPDDSGWLFAYLTTASDNRVVRMRLQGAAGRYALDTASLTVILKGLPFASNHDGGRIKFGPDGDLYVTVGDANHREEAQDTSYLGGKILRIQKDGTIPGDNPIAGSPVYSLGHRNPQGLAWDSQGRMWAAEFGQDTWDEINLIEPGRNYGWPVVEGRSNDTRFVSPVQQWATSDASPSGLLYTHDTLFLAALKGERLWAIYPTGSPVQSYAYFIGKYGRLRDVIDGPDGTIWILTNNTARGVPQAGDDQILQVKLGSLGD